MMSMSDMMNMLTINAIQQAENEKMANAIRDFCIKNQMGSVRIYFNGKAYAINNKLEINVLDDIVGSTYFEYANDETVSMSFDGSIFYDVLNYADEHYSKLEEKFSSILEKFGYYYELGYAWSLSLYKI